MSQQRFKDYQKQRAYEYAQENHELLMQQPSGYGEAYRDGYNNNTEAQPKKTTYPVWLAGRDRQKADIALGCWHTDDSCSALQQLEQSSGFTLSQVA